MTDDRPGSNAGDDSDALSPEVLEFILRLVTGDTDVRPALTADRKTVALLIPATALAARRLVAHGRTCHRPTTCPEIPPPLRKFLKMRVEMVLRNTEQVARALLQFPDHKFTAHVRGAWLLKVSSEEYGRANLIEDIESGSIFTVDALRSALGEDPAIGAPDIATTLWARGLESPKEAVLFSAMRPFADGQGDQEPPPTEEVARPETRRSARREERQQIQRLEREIKDLKRERRRLTDTLTRATDEQASAKTRLQQLESDLADAQAKAESLAGELRLAQGHAQIADRERVRATSSAAELRTDAEAARAERAALQQARSRVVGELALRNREIEALRARLRTIPTGADAVHAFLADEERRIDEGLLIHQGADRQRAAKEHADREKLEDAFRAAYPQYVPPRPLVRTTPAELTVEPLGGADEVGRSAYLLTLGTKSILVDCGIKIGERHLDELAPDIAHIRPDAVVLTHAHTDHLGWLPAVVRQSPDVAIYCTPATAELVPIMLDDCHRHHLVMMERLRRDRAHSSNPESIVDTYEREDVWGVADRLIGIPFGESETMPFADIRLRFVRAGHILGAASALIEGGGRRILMSGDISSEPQLTVAAVDWSEVEGDLDLLVLESTYGDVVREPLAQGQEQLVTFAQRVIGGSGSLILPCFGLGRGQEVAMLIAKAMEAGDLARVTVWIDGMIRDINGVYREHEPAFRLPDANFQEIEGSYERAYVIEEARRQPVIVVTTSGMLAGGPAVEYARQLLPEPKNRIAFTGYQDEGNPGYALLKLTQAGLGMRTIQIPNEEGELVEIRAAAPAKQFQLSAHADQNGLVANAATVQPRNILLVHGFERTQRPLRERLHTALRSTEVLLGAQRKFSIR